MRRWIKKITEHKLFQQGILLAILINTLSMGIEYHNQVDYSFLNIIWFLDFEITTNARLAKINTNKLYLAWRADSGCGDKQHCFFNNLCRGDVVKGHRRGSIWLHQQWIQCFRWDCRCFEVTLQIIFIRRLSTYTLHNRDLQFWTLASWNCFNPLLRNEVAVLAWVSCVPSDYWGSWSWFASCQTYEGSCSLCFAPWTTLQCSFHF